MPSVINPEEYGVVSNCQICSHGILTALIDLGHHAPVHAHLTAAKLYEPETMYPLTLCHCGNCGLLQLNYIVDPRIIFHPDYPYLSGMTNMLIRDFRQLRDTLIERYELNSADLVVDIGSNDGSLLAGFQEKELRVLGVEPTNIARIANGNGIPTLQEFFTQQTADSIIIKHGKAKVVTATNIFAHVNNAFDLVQSISSILADDGIFVSESQYLLDMIEKTALDTIYHEHLRYYLLKPLQKLLALGGMTLVDAERLEAAGGSIRIYAQKGKPIPSERVEKLIAAEIAAGAYDTATFVALSEKIKQAKQSLLEILIQCKKNNARIVGIGAPGRSNTLLGFTHIDKTFLDYAVEKTGSPKIGLFTPGTHIPIVDEAILFTDQPDYGLLLSWHIGEELMKKLRSLGFKGKFIVPLPVPHIVDYI